MFPFVRATLCLDLTKKLWRPCKGEDTAMLSKKVLLRLCFALTILTPVLSKAADVVEMKNGDIYRGEIIQQEFGSYIQVRFSDGNEKRLTWEAVKGVKREENELKKFGQLKQVGRPGDSMVTAGLVTFGATYAVTALTCLATCEGSHYPFFPVVGPFLQISKTDSTFGLLNALSGTVQTLSIAYAIMGSVTNSNHDQQTGAIRMFFTPAPDGAGVLVRADF